MSWHVNLYAVVEVAPVRVVSMHPTIKEAAHAARKLHRHRPCDVMGLVLDDNDRPIGVQQLTNREKRSIIGWQPEFKMRPEDVVNSRHRYDPPETNAGRLQADPARHTAPSPTHPDILSADEALQDL